MDNNCSKIKIAIFTVSMGCGGAERVISRLLPQISMKHDVVLMLLDTSKIEYDVNVPIVSLGEKESKNRFVYACSLVKASVRFKEYIRKNNITCVLSFLSIPNIINIIFNTGAKRVISVRGQLFVKGSILSRIKQFVEKKIYKKADKIVVPSKQLKEDLIGICKVQKEKIKVIYNPIDANEIESMSNMGIDSSHEHLFENNKVIVALGRMTYEKGFDHLLRVFSRVVQTNKNVKLMIIGDGKILNQLKTLSKELDLVDNVIFTGKKANPFPYLKRADVFVMSSVSEGFPNALIEAMSCGVPVISTDCKSGPREILCDSDNMCQVGDGFLEADYGILTPPFNMEGEDNDNAYLQMSLSILKMLDNKSMRDNYVYLAKERAKYFSVEKSLNGYFEVIG